jgi:hypothetical protein
MMRVRLLENLHLPLWLIKDACWALVWKPLGIMMISPTLLLSIYLTWRSRNSPAEFLPNLSISFWISANSIWMIDEFYELGIRTGSLVFFALGLFSIAYWLIKYFPVLWKNSKNQ